ncbi:uncharacterized protein [Periplaneta americana]|uniref:uncharacterized protein n=1 Tax=Periplaneta americana TaxID=6978 RepID=UPI0037E8CE83
MAVRTCLLALFLAIIAGSAFGKDKKSWDDDYDDDFYEHAENARKRAETLVIIYVCVGLGILVVITIIVFSCLCCKGCPFYMRHRRGGPGVIYTSNTSGVPPTQRTVAVTSTAPPSSAPPNMQPPPPYYTHPGFVYQQQHNQHQNLHQYQHQQQYQSPYYQNNQQYQNNHPQPSPEYQEVQYQQR